MEKKTKQKTLEVVTKSGKKLMVDISDESCLKFGFKHKDQVIDSQGHEGTIMGVGPSCDCVLCQLTGTAGKDAIHVAYDEFDGRTFSTTGNLLDLGFRLKSKTETEPELIMTHEVTGISGKTFKVDISDEACLKFGFKHRERIADRKGNKGTVMGVAPMIPERKLSQTVLWIAADTKNDKVLSVSKKGLKEMGFKKLENE